MYPRAPVRLAMMRCDVIDKERCVKFIGLKPNYVKDFVVKNHNDVHSKNWKWEKNRKATSRLRGIAEEVYG
jgi:hypothetical protein